MPDEFGGVLSQRIQSHSQFWSDLTALQSRAVLALSLGQTETTGGATLDPIALPRLMYSASVFAHSTEEKTRGLAQSIALCALITNPEPKIAERSKAILAGLGNYPAVTYVEAYVDDASSTLLSKLQIELVKELNSVEIEGKEVALTEFQYEVWKSLPVTRATAISAPTSAGKSFLVIEYLCSKAANEDKFTAIFVAPTRALLSEVQHKIEKRLKGVGDLRVSTVPSPDAQLRSKQIFVLTQERLHVLLSSTKLAVNLVVVDEAQGLADGPRGMILQDCLEHLRTDNPNMQMVFLAPGADGFDNVAAALGISGMVVKETTLSPVQQNRVQVTTRPGLPKEFNLSLLTPTGAREIGSVPTKRGVADANTRLTVAALELGNTGAALVYATGPAEAEKIGAQFVADRPVIENKPLSVLSEFIKKHIHPDYGLASMVRHGVAFHYGHMPTLLREALENAFRNGDLHYLVCTTTLFQGVNLPARSVFIDTPTRGRGTPLEAAHLWNFAGRAGRLGQELAGNVFLVDYEDWAVQPMNENSKFKIVPAFSETISANFEAVLAAVAGNMPKADRRDPRPSQIRAAAGLLLARASVNSIAGVLGRISTLTERQRRSIEAEASKAIVSLNLPNALIQANWTVDPYGLKRLANRMTEKVERGEVEALIPTHPNDPKAYKVYPGIINRALRELLGVESRAYGGLVSTYALSWMRGTPYPALLSKWITYKQKNSPRAKINDLIRRGFEFFEQVLRFQMVQVGKAYLDVLHHVLQTLKLADRRREAFDFFAGLGTRCVEHHGPILYRVGNISNRCHGPRRFVS